MPASPNKNRVSISNLSSRVNRIWVSVFPSNSRSTPQSTDIVNIKTSDGDPYYTTIAEFQTVASGATVLTSYLSSALPSAVPAGQLIYISDLAVLAYSNGSNWVT